MQASQPDVKGFTLDLSKVGYQHDPDVFQLRRSVMTKLILFILLSVIAAPAVQAADRKDSLRHFMEFCNQFVITDPGPSIRFNYHHDCHINDWDAPWRWDDNTKGVGSPSGRVLPQLKLDRTRLATGSRQYRWSLEAVCTG
jgi:hypothetical protein